MYGHVNYLIIGARGSGLLVKGEHFEDFIQLTYNHKTTSTMNLTLFDQRTGKPFNPSEGVNLAFGLNYLFSKYRTGPYLGLKIEPKTKKDGETKYRIVGGFRF